MKLSVLSFNDQLQFQIQIVTFTCGSGVKFYNSNNTMSNSVKRNLSNKYTSSTKIFTQKTKAQNVLT